ncbi:MAG: serpin family protein [Bacteroidia bacterium]|nr:serpin family protein [Bacteroidia bacterium]
MKRILHFLFFALTVSFLTGCDSLTKAPDDTTPEEYLPVGGSGPIQLRAALLPQVSRDNAFALNLFRTMAANSGDSNIIISPLSISIALGMAWNGANGGTKAEMSGMLGTNGMADSLVNQYYEVMQKSLPVVDSSTVVNLANSLWYAPDFIVKPTYLKLNQDYFDAEIRKIDFHQTKAKDTINAWVDTKTNHLIDQILNATDDERMILINAVYFKGAWVKPFNPEKTYSSTFTKQNGGTKPINMMSMLDTLRYGEDTNAQYLDLPYGNGAFSMTVVLPKAGKTTTTVLSALTPESLNATISSLVKQKVSVNLPRFKVACDFSLVKPLKALGMNLAFTDIADFSSISEEPVMISNILHKTFVEVTEKGTKAAAVTAILFETTSAMPDFPFFIVDKPFLFFIRENGTKTILFAGKVGDIDKF